MKLNSLKILFLFSLFLVKSSITFSQSPKIISQNCLAEKIYLQLDSKVYAQSDVIYFKSIVTNSVNHQKSNLSEVLYVELIDKNKKTLQKKIIKLSEGKGSGFFELPESIAEGHYWVLGYTEWNRNFGKEFVFKEDIQVVSSLVKKGSFTKIELSNSIDKTKRIFSVNINPFLIDQKHRFQKSML